ncbi:CCKAR [Mytilus coruscus]|uniref:CCKAR n=1 Tax=Mytilus coruscus TaxID=42192 RepID=A0A6J8BHH8_MYTCO|nr:CCKAR [Mytilus coruscus]
MTNETNSKLLDVLVDIEEDERIKRIPVAVFIGILTIVGILGNFNILVIFSRNSKHHSTYHVLVSALAVSDLVVCITHLPVEIIMVMKPLSFDFDIVCRLVMMNSYVWGCWTVFLILLIAIERYRRICYPFKDQVSCAHARKLCVILFVLAAINAIPMGYISGTHTFPLSNSTNGFECFVNDSLQDSYFPVTYFIILLIEVVLIGLAIFCLYIPVRSKIIKSTIIRKQMTNRNVFKKTLKEEVSCTSITTISFTKPAEKVCQSDRQIFESSSDSSLEPISTNNNNKQETLDKYSNSKDLDNTKILSPGNLLPNPNGLHSILSVAASVDSMDTIILQKTRRSSAKMLFIKTNMKSQAT